MISCRYERPRMPNSCKLSHSLKAKSCWRENEICKMCHHFCQQKVMFQHFRSSGLTGYGWIIFLFSELFCIIITLALHFWWYVFHPFASISLYSSGISPYTWDTTFFLSNKKDYIFNGLGLHIWNFAFTFIKVEDKFLNISFLKWV